MTEEEKKAIERAEFLVSIPTYLEKDMCKNLLNYIDKLQKELDLKDKENKAVTYNFEKTVDKLEIAYKVIDLMIEQIEKDTEWYYGEFDNKNTKEIKEYFFKKVEEENE